MNVGYEAWERYIKQGDAGALSEVRPPVRESWKRCRERGMDPAAPVGKALPPEELKKHRTQSGHLLRIAKGVLERLYDSVKGYGFAILLLDADCVVLEVLGDKGFLDDHAPFRPGELWGEEYKGTSAMSLAQREQKAIQVAAEEHYIESNHRLTCSAAPIFEPGGRFVGIVDVSGNSEETHAHTLGMVIAAAKAIEEGLRLETANQEINETMRILWTVIESISEAVIIIDREGTITNINKKVFTLLGLRWSDCRGKPVTEMLPNDKDLVEQILKYGRFTSIHETMPDKTKLLINGYPIMDKRQTVCGGVIIICDKNDALSQRLPQPTMQPRITFESIIGESEALRACVATAKNVADSATSIYLEGESGTGKEMFAQSIHNASPFASGPFVAISCAAIPRTLIESELFGYEDGTFSGGKKGGKAGKFELANNGTLFLDEIADMPLDTQVSLLRVLQEKQVVRIGGYRPIPVRIRILSATNKCLEEEVEKGNFRADLYYRLNVIKIVPPPLRERGEDVLLLARHFLEHFATQLGCPAPPLSAEVCRTLMGYGWPGNVRELSNAMERAVNLTKGATIRTAHLPEALRPGGAAPAVGGAPPQPEKARAEAAPPAAASLDEVERQLLEKTLRETRGNISHTAAQLGISRNTLYRKMDKFGLKRAREK